MPVVSLAEHVAAAERRLQEAASPALYAAPSDREISEKIGEHERLRRLKLAQDVREQEAELQVRQASLQRRLARDAKDAAEEDRRLDELARTRRWQQRAADEAEQLTSRAAQLAATAKLLITAKRAIITGIVVLLAWSGVNVQQQLVPSGDQSDPLFWLSYALDGALGGTLVLLMLTSARIARAGVADTRAGRLFSRYLQEAVILGASLVLNTASHLRHGELVLAVKSAIPGAMIGMLVWAYNHITDRLSETLIKLTGDVETEQQVRRDLAAAQADVAAARELEAQLREVVDQAQAHAQAAAAEVAALRAERDGRAVIRLDAEIEALMPHVRRGFEGLAAGTLDPSMAEDGGGVPAAGQLATRLGLSRPVAMKVRDLMKKLRGGDAALVVSVESEEDAAHGTLVPSLSLAQ
uniref:hypothetical protein n=1 Tax=Amycolatopsis sp. CA-151526 TaxID=3239921 RepID=UPI003F490935